MANILYPEEHDKVKRRSSIDQFANYLAVMKQGGWAPIVFDQLDGITCDTIKTHPVVISWDDVNYVFPESRCDYPFDEFITFDKDEVEQIALPPEFGGEGELIDVFSSSNQFVNIGASSVGSHNIKRTRVGASYVLSDETLPAVE